VFLLEFEGRFGLIMKKYPKMEGKHHAYIDRDRLRNVGEQSKKA